MLLGARGLTLLFDGSEGPAGLYDRHLVHDLIGVTIVASLERIVDNCLIVRGHMQIVLEQRARYLVWRRQVGGTTGPRHTIISERALEWMLCIAH